MEYTFYKLQIGDKCYVGSTIDFKHRMDCHKHNCNNKNSKKYNYKVYQYMRQNGGFEKVDIMIIDKIIYNNKEQALDIETKFMLSFNAELNTQYPKRSQKEWKNDNKESVAKQKQQYYEEHKDKWKESRERNRDKINERKREKVACDICGKMSSKGHISRHKKTHR
jgi:hypothetical protein